MIYINDPATEMMVRGRALPLVQINTKDDAVLRKYLLGDLSIEEQESVDLWLMSDEDAYDLLEAAEDDLIDDSMAGRLTGRDLDLFNKHFLAAPQRQRKLQFSRSFRRAIDSASRPPVPPVWIRFLDALRYRPVLAYAGAALVLLLIVGSVWSLVTVEQLQRKLNTTTAQLANAGRDREDLKRQLQESQAANRTLEAQFRTLETSVAATKSSPAPVLLAVSLIPGITRSSNQVPTVMLTANTSLVRFSLALLDDNFPAYRASCIMDGDGREVWSGGKVAATATRGGKVIELTVPAQALSNGDYSFNLMGMPDAGAPESVARYSFRAVR